MLPQNLDYGILKYTISGHYLLFTTLKFKRQTSSPKIFSKKDYNGMNLNNFVNDLSDIELYSAFFTATITAAA